MNCPRCRKPNAKYKERREEFHKSGEGSDKKTFKRIDHIIICKGCGEFDEYNFQKL